MRPKFYHKRKSINSFSYLALFYEEKAESGNEYYFLVAKNRDCPEFYDQNFVSFNSLQPKAQLKIKNKAGKWCFPGGESNSGEDALAAAHREFWEETGVAIETPPKGDVALIVEHGRETIVTVSNNPVANIVFTKVYPYKSNLIMDTINRIFGQTKDDRIKYLKDDELCEVEWVNIDEAIQRFNKDGVDWFETAICNFMKSLTSKS